jgi:hypothetical protein
MITVRRHLAAHLDRIEQALWGSHDAEMRAIGFHITRVGRWRRTYRHPAIEDAILARARATERVSGRIDRTEAPTQLLNINTPGAA